MVSWCVLPVRRASGAVGECIRAVGGRERCRRLCGRSRSRLVDWAPRTSTPTAPSPAECECVHTVLYYRYHTLPLYLYKEWLLLKELIFIWVQFTIRIDPFCLQKRNRKRTRIERSARAPVLNLIASCAIALNPSVVISSSTCSVRQQNGLCKSCYT